MNLSAVIAAAYVEVQRTTGRKLSLSGRLDQLLKRPVDHDFNALRGFTLLPDKVYVDIGANRGAAIAAARLFLPRAPIVAFEPNPLLGSIIKARHAGDCALTLNQVRLSDTPGQYHLHVPYYQGEPFDGLASFGREEAAAGLRPDRMLGFNAKHQEIKTFDCQVSTLDAFQLAPAFIKIDVQGLEPAVIRGGLATIERHLPVVLMENNAPATDAADLFRLGYVSYAFLNNALVAGSYGDLNTFYIHPKMRDGFAADLFAKAS